MTSEEIMSFQGHEFTYVFEDNDTMSAYVKKIDLEKELLSFWSFSLVTDSGYEFEPLDDEEKIEGACCLGYSNTLDKIIEFITEIKTIRKHLSKQTGIYFDGCPF